jgi:hypothetical protein
MTKRSGTGRSKHHVYRIQRQARHARKGERKSETLKHSTTAMESITDGVSRLCGGDHLEEYSRYVLCADWSVLGQSSHRLLQIGCPLFVSVVGPFSRTSVTANGVHLPLSRRWTTGTNCDAVVGDHGGQNRHLRTRYVDPIDAISSSVVVRARQLHSPRVTSAKGREETSGERLIKFSDGASVILMGAARRRA